MNLNGLFGMLVRRLMGTAVRKGIDHFARGGKPEAEMTPEERKKAQSLRQMASNAQRVARFGRRFMK